MRGAAVASIMRNRNFRSGYIARIGAMPTGGSIGVPNHRRTPLTCGDILAGECRKALKFLAGNGMCPCQQGRYLMLALQVFEDSGASCS